MCTTFSPFWETWVDNLAKSYFCSNIKLSRHAVTDFNNLFSRYNLVKLVFTIHDNQQHDKKTQTQLSFRPSRHNWKAHLQEPKRVQQWFLVPNYIWVTFQQNDRSSESKLVKSVFDYYSPKPCLALPLHNDWKIHPQLIQWTGQKFRTDMIIDCDRNFRVLKRDYG